MYEIYSDAYVYSNISSSKLSDYIYLICKKHGSFKKRLSHLLNGKGCPYCVGKGKMNKEIFVNKANEIFNGEYIYDEFEYVNAHTQSYIICKKHGKFVKTPTAHLSGQGCPICTYERLSKENSMGKEMFISKSIDKHGIFYDYTNVEYINNSTDVAIGCPIHGIFYQTPNNHLSGRGCPLCKQSHLERDIKLLLDKIGVDYEFQKRFEWLGKRLLDYYLPKYNIGIECQGKQHFGRGWGEKNFKEVIESDIIKYKLCNENGVKLVYYTNVFEPIEFYDDKIILKNNSEITDYIISLIV